MSGAHIFKMLQELKTHIHSLAIVAALLLGAVSCGRKPPVTPQDEESETTVAVYKGCALVDSKAGSQFILVQASGEWALSLQCHDGGKWATLSKDGGIGPKNNIILSYEANPTGEARVVTLTLSTAKAQAVCSLTQSGISQGSAENTGVPSTDRSWMELPATSSSDGLDYFSLSMKHDGASFRNFSYYWDYDNFVSHWVAYPLNRSLMGSGSRSNAWALDPNLPETLQPNLTMRGFRPYGYDRGHQCPSADRLTNVEANTQTFYGTNMTPQLADFNQGIWGRLEGRVRGWAESCDTLYVVTGCVVKPNSTKGVYGEIGGYATDNVNSRVSIPTAYYKALLRYSKTSSYGRSGYAACALYLEHKNYGDVSVSKRDAISIDELERLTGVDFFVNLPAAIGQQDADFVEAQNPSTVSVWW